MIRRRKNRIMPLNVSHGERLVEAAGGPVLTQNEARAKLNLPPNAHGDFFVHNLMAIRAEERLGLGRKRPTAFHRLVGWLITIYAIRKAVT